MPERFGPDERRVFKRQGYVVLDDILDTNDVKAARDEIWTTIPETPADVGESYRTPYEIANGDDIKKPDAFESIQYDVFAAANELVGGVLQTPASPFDLSQEMQLALNFPRKTRLRHTHQRANNGGYADSGGHIDGYNTLRSGEEGASLPEYFTVGATIYFDSVEQNGGGFVVFPGSHHVVAEYFKDHSLEGPSWRGRLPAIDDTGGWTYETSLAEQLRASEITGGAGTVILWHNKLLHGSGYNQREALRLAGISRFQHDRSEEIRRDAASEIWKYWPALQDIEIDFERNPM